MARFNEILAGRYNRYLQKLFQLKGGPPSAQLASEVMPVYPFFAGVENRYLEGWDRFGLFRGQGALAATSTNFRLRNPAGSNVMVVLEKINLVEGTADTFGIRGLFPSTPANDLGASMIPVSLDARTQRPQSTLLLTSGNAANVGVPFGFLSTLATQSGDFILFEDQELTMLPGQLIEVQTTNLNVSVNIGLLWRERAMEESELK